MTPARQHDLGRGKIGNRLGAAKRADGLFLRADLAAPARQVGVGGKQLLIDVGGRDPKRGEARRIELHADFATGAAISLNAADALETLDIADNDVIDMPGQLLQGHRRGFGRVGDDGLALDIDPAHHRLVDGLGQIAPNARHGVFHIVDGAIAVDLEIELDAGLRLAIGDGRIDMLDAGDAGYGILDLLCHLVA